MRPLACFLCLAIGTLGTCGCTSFQDYVRNGFKVGPNYGRPPAPVAKDWIDAADKRVRTDSDDLSKWWTVFNDPVLDSLVCLAYQQNLTLRKPAAVCWKPAPSSPSTSATSCRKRQSATAEYLHTATSHDTANINQFTSAEALVRQLGLWIQPELGARLLGPVPAGGRSGLRQPGRLGRKL